MNLKRLSLVAAAILTTGAAQAQETVIRKKLPAYRTETEKQLSIIRNRQEQASQSLGKTGNALPEGIRYPGEFEESQSVLISWSYDYNASPVKADVTSEYAVVSANLAAEIQKVVPVIIRISLASDSTAIKSYMSNRGTPLTNYQFMIAPGDDWWTRDFGPNGVYYGTGDSLAFIDMKYYAGRDDDDVFPATMAANMGIPNYVSKIQSEGGNLMADGFGGVFFSSRIVEINTDPDYMFPAWNAQQTLDTLKKIYAGSQMFNLTSLTCDGGTGHIDLYIKLIDEQTIMASKYPDVITARDKKTIEDNMQMLASKNGPYGRPYRVYRIPHPTDDSGNHTRVTCAQIDADARTFVNGLSVNDTYIMPSYSDATTGNKAQTEEAKTLMRAIMPGYKVVDIDSRLLSVLGGEIHCITMQIPADNPVLFWHPSVDGYYKDLQSDFHIVAKITNRSGIARALCKWRKKGETTFRDVTLTDSSGYFIGNISAPGLTTADEIEYYLEATTVNGKTATKPLNAANGGYYNIHFFIRTGVDDMMVQTKNYLFNAYPNPANSRITIAFYAETADNAAITVTDVTGKQIKTISNSVQNGLNEAVLDVSELNNGIYFYTYTLDGNVIATRKFIVNK